MRDPYENLDQYAMYDYKDVVNAYGHGEDDAVDCVLEIIEKADDENRNHLGVVLNADMDKAYSIIWERVLALKGGEQG